MKQTMFKHSKLHNGKNRNLWFLSTSDHHHRCPSPLSALEHGLLHQAGAAGGEGERVDDELLPTLGEGDQLVVEVLLMASRLDARSHHAPTTLLTGTSTPCHPHQLDVLLVASLWMVHDEPELPVLVLRCPRHDVLGCQAADVLKSILVEFFMHADIDRISAIVNCITIAAAVHFLSALIISGASESVAKNRFGGSGDDEGAEEVDGSGDGDAVDNGRDAVDVSEHGELHEDGFENICGLTTEYIMPRAAKNKNGQFRFIVNHPEGGDEQYIQLVRVARCAGAGEECGWGVMGPGIETRCHQEYLDHKLVALSESGEELVIDTFNFPSCCTW